MLVDGQQDGNLLGRGSATAIPRILFLGTASLTRIKSAKNRPDNQRPSVFACVMIYLLSISGKWNYRSEIKMSTYKGNS